MDYEVHKMHYFFFFFLLVVAMKRIVPENSARTLPVNPFRAGNVAIMHTNGGGIRTIMYVGHQYTGYISASFLLVRCTWGQFANWVIVPFAIQNLPPQQQARCVICALSLTNKSVAHNIFRYLPRLQRGRFS